MSLHTDLKIFSFSADFSFFLLLKFTHFLLFSAQFELFYLDFKLFFSFFEHFQCFWQKVILRTVHIIYTKLTAKIKQKDIDEEMTKGQKKPKWAIPFFFFRY